MIKPLKALVVVMWQKLLEPETWADARAIEATYYSNINMVNIYIT